MNSVLGKIQKSREYLDYIEEHYNNVQKAFEVSKIKWKELPIIYDDWKFNRLKSLVEFHDDSKLSEHEFVQYRKYFFPTEYEEYYANSSQGVPAKAFAKKGFDYAWEHHKSNNYHHWQSLQDHMFYEELYVAEMVLDWIAMGYKFNNTAIEQYEKEKHLMFEFDENVHAYIIKLLSLFYDKEV